MAASQLSSPVWHVATALLLTLVVVVTDRDGGASAAPRDRAAPVAHPVAQVDSETYRGYRLDLSALGGGADAGTIRKAAEHQVDLVEATALDARTKAFLRRFLVMVRSGSGSGSHYSGGDTVTAAVADPGDDRPILLHEFLHVYHVRLLPGGTGNPGVRTFYERARTGGFYPADSYALKNPREFFAMTASVFLHGHLAREPFTHDEMRRKQPVYDRYLACLFGTPGA